MITRLFIKRTKGQPLEPVQEFCFGPDGIAGNVPCLPLRQVLLIPTKTLSTFNLNPGDLRENVVVEYDGLHDIPSGTILEIGESRVRLTFHCESCGKIATVISPKAIAHQRGYFGSFLNTGCMKIGDQVRVGAKLFEEIPFGPTERIRWFLMTNSAQITAVNLLKQIGFSPTYCRVLPKWLEPLEPALKDFVEFTTRSALNK